MFAGHGQLDDFALESNLEATEARQLTLSGGHKRFPTDSRQFEASPSDKNQLHMVIHEVAPFYIDPACNHKGSIGSL